MIREFERRCHPVIAKPHLLADPSTVLTNFQNTYSDKQAILPPSVQYQTDRQNPGDMTVSNADLPGLMRHRIGHQAKSSVCRQGFGSFAIFTDRNNDSGNCLSFLLNLQQPGIRWSDRTNRFDGFGRKRLRLSFTILPEGNDG